MYLSCLPLSLSLDLHFLLPDLSFRCTSNNEEGTWYPLKVIKLSPMATPYSLDKTSSCCIPEGACDARLQTGETQKIFKSPVPQDKECKKTDEMAVE